MFTRSFLIFVLFFSGDLYLSACSCIDVHTSLEDVICHADSTGGLVLELEMTIRIGDNNQARFRVADVHVGSTELREINLSGFSSCAWYMREDDRPGKRYLYFTHPENLDDGEGSLFNCGFNSNIYRMNSRGTKVEYPVGVNGMNTRLAERDASAVLSGGCANGRIIVDPFRDLILTNNPGPGQLSILNSGEEFPRISSIDVYNTNGQRMRHIEPENPNLPAPIDLQGVPTGVYLVVVRKGPFLKTLRYVKR